jgi:T5orf172 domain
MAFHSKSTPESLLPRSDSKNPATTCKGITSNGRPCRRSLAQSANASTASSPREGPGVLAVVPNVDGRKHGAAAFYCWQHQDQATALVGGHGGETEILSLQPRNSTESLAAQLGVLSIDEDRSRRHMARRGNHSSRPVRRDTLPSTWQGVPSPLMSVPEGHLPQRPGGSARKRRRGDLHVTFLCCTRSSDIKPEHLAALKPVPPQRSHRPLTSRPPPGINIESSPQSNWQSAHPQPPPLAQVAPPKASQGDRSQSQSAYTQALLSFIPAHLNSATREVLLAELSKSLTAADREPGYIYIFWLTPRDGPQPGASDASTLLAPPTRPAVHGRRTSDIMRTYSVKAPDGPKRRTLMLKIGRANNVHRRMVEWSRQCGHHITLLRYYPTASQTGGFSASPSPAASPSRKPVPSPGRSTQGRDDNDNGDGSSLPTKVSLVPRVERLIHAELASQRVIRACEGCGRQHREWFAIDATREGVRNVDQTVRRWVEWGIEEGKGL